MDRKLGGLVVHNSAGLINPETRWCMLVFGPSKIGKTTFAASLGEFTNKYRNGPTIFIAVEEAEGGGTMSISELGMDYVKPKSHTELKGVIAELATDKYYQGVVLDSATDTVGKLIKPVALGYPSREKMQSRESGVPEMSDYQIMGELCNTDITRLVGLTTLKGMAKDLIVTALQKDRVDRKTQELLSIGPDLPGAMAIGATAKFQTVVQLKIQARMGKDEQGRPLRVLDRVLITQADGLLNVGDRTKVLPVVAEPNILTLWEKYWLPRFEQEKKNG